jgi:hypothetical protein
MKFGLWFLSAAAIGAVGTVLAASLPVPPSLPRIASGLAPATPTPIAAAPAPSAPAEPTPPPAPMLTHAAPPPQAAAMPPPAPAIQRPKRITAAVIAAGSAGPSHTARHPARRLAKATPDRHRRIVAHAVGPRYGAIVPKPPYPYMREPTHIAMAPPPPYGMPPPYWRMPYPPN